MTIKELCTKVREAAERATGGEWSVGQQATRIEIQGRRGFQGNYRVVDAYHSGSLANTPRFDEACANAEYIVATQPANARALLGRIEELEKALEPFAALGIEDSIFNPIAPLQADKARAALSGDTP